MKYGDKTVCLVDNGLFCDWGPLLAKDFGQVLYYMPWESSYPKSNALLVGAGLQGVKRLKDFWSELNQIDLFVFPDIYYGQLQLHLESIGKRVWGCRMGENIELDRAGAKEFCEMQGIDIGPYQVIIGTDALREYLKTHDNQYVKISTTRGDMETFHAKNYKLIETRIDTLEHTIGPMKKIMQFVVEDALDPAVETGYDGYCIDGQFPKGAMFGIEVKDQGYLMKAATYADLPKTVTSVNDKLRAAFKAMHYRSFWSTEIRVTEDGTPYLIDPCPRAGSPPNELYQELISNWADILWEGADGNLVEPDFVAEWGAELLLISEWSDKNWLPIEFPPELRDHVKLRNACFIDGKYYIAPQWTGYPECGAVVAVGDTQEEAIDACREIAEQVEGYYVHVCSDCLDTAVEEFSKT